MPLNDPILSRMSKVVHHLFVDLWAEKQDNFMRA